MSQCVCSLLSSIVDLVPREHLLQLGPSTVNSLYCGHLRDCELVSFIVRVHSHRNFIQSNVCNLSLRGFSCCPYYWGVRNSKVSARRELTVYYCMYASATWKRRIRKFLTTESTKVLVHAFIMGRIDYCNSLLYGLPTIHINKLQHVQNAAARLICSTPRFSHVTPVLFSLHWLPVKFRIDFKILIITFKAIHGQAPDYICNLVNIRNFSTYGLCSNSELLLVPPSTKTKKTLGDRAFTAAAPSLWNKLPSAIRDEDDLTRFKSKLKTFLFRVAYNTM